MNLTRETKIYIAGADGMVGLALKAYFREKGFIHLLCPARGDLDLTNQADVAKFFKKNSVDLVILAAGKVGGIQANSEFPAQFIYDNSAIALNVIHQAFLSGVRKLLYFGSSCMYPRLCEQPMKEGSILSAYMEPTSEPYSLAKVLGMKMCLAYNRQFDVDYRVVIPASIYGGRDSFHVEYSHVIPALITKFHQAKMTSKNFVELWGTGNPRREFIHIRDLVEGVEFVLRHDRGTYLEMLGVDGPINLGCGYDVSINELASLIKGIVGFKGDIRFDSTKPDGAPQKLLDSTKLKHAGWRSKIGLESGIFNSYRLFLEK